MATVQELREQLEAQQKILLQQLTQQVSAETAAPLASPQTSEFAKTLTLPTNAIDLVKQWAEEDEDYPDDRRTVEDMIDDLVMAKDFECSHDEAEKIIAEHYPNAPRKKAAPVLVKSNPTAPGLDAIKPLIEQGLIEPTEDGAFLLKRCKICGRFDQKCGHREFDTVGAVRYGSNELTAFGRQAVGLDPIAVPVVKSAEQREAERVARFDQSAWWTKFKGAGELEGNGSIKMHVENFVPEGITLICGLPKEGKSWLALSIAKALTTGSPLFGKAGYEVPEPVPVLYLAAESGDGALKLRTDKMGITHDKKMFLARTLTQGLMLELKDPLIEEVIKDLRPVVILETLIRFNDGTDEDSSTENRKLAEALFRLIAWGAKAVIGIHHSRKDLDKRRPTKESAVRGSGDGLAMVDAVWLVMQDSQLYHGGKGANEVEIVGWGRDFNPVPIRLALTRPKLNDSETEFAPGMVSTIDQNGDLEWVQHGLKFETDSVSVSTPSKDIDLAIDRLVIETPTVTRQELVERSGQTTKRVIKSLQRLGYSRGKGDKGATKWVKKAA